MIIISTEYLVLHSALNYKTDKQEKLIKNRTSHREVFYLLREINKREFLWEFLLGNAIFAAQLAR